GSASQTDRRATHRERVRAKTAEKQAVEGDHAGNREEVEAIRRREPQQRGQDRPFEQQFGSRRNGAGSGRTSRDGRKECWRGICNASLAHRRSSPHGAGAALETEASSRTGWLR